VTDNIGLHTYTYITCTYIRTDYATVKSVTIGRIAFLYRKFLALSFDILSSMFIVYYVLSASLI